MHLEAVRAFSKLPSAQIQRGSPGFPPEPYQSPSPSSLPISQRNAPAEWRMEDLLPWKVLSDRWEWLRIHRILQVHSFGAPIPAASMEELPQKNLKRTSIKHDGSQYEFQPTCSHKPSQTFLPLVRWAKKNLSFRKSLSQEKDQARTQVNCFRPCKFLNLFFVWKEITPVCGLNCSWRYVESQSIEP